MSSFVSSSLRMSLIAAGIAFGAASFSPALAQTKPAAPAAASPADTVIAKGNGFTVTEKDLLAAMEDPAIGAESLPEDQKRETLIGYLVDLKAIAHAAEAAKVEQSADFTKKLNDIKQQLIVQTYLDQEIKKLVTPEAVRKFYDDTVKDMKPVPEVRARHILVETEDQAKAVLERLKKGEDFAKIAAEVSKDTGSKESGGELGFFSMDRMVAPFSEAAFKLEPNQISEPVKTDFGWHVIQVEEKRERPVPSFDDLKGQVEAYLTRQSQQQVIENIRKQANVQRLDKPAEAPAADKAPATPAKEPAKEPAQKK